jgi:two-component system, OmpR family, sensor kinase
MLPRSLRGRLTLWYALLMVAAFAVFSATTLLVHGSEEDADSPEEMAETHKLELSFAIGIPFVLAIAVAGGSLIIRRSLRPFDDLVRVARSLDSERLDTRVPIQQGAAGEIVAVAVAFNAMLDRIARSVAGTQRFTADASHELRTPLAALRSELEVGLRREREAADYHSTLERALGEVDRMTRLVEALLVLARSDAGGQPLRREPVHVGELIRGAVLPVAAAASRAVELDCDPSLVVSADADGIARAVANLVENACKHTAAGTAVRVEARASGGFVDIAIDDAGEGIASIDRERAFERFHRGAQARNKAGAGLGLALALDIARHHGGTILLEDSPLGGLRARMRLPQLDFAPV